MSDAQRKAGSHLFTKGLQQNSAGARLDSLKHSSTKPTLKYKGQLSVGFY